MAKWVLFFFLLVPLFFGWWIPSTPEARWERWPPRFGVSKRSPGWITWMMIVILGSKFYHEKFFEIPSWPNDPLICKLLRYENWCSLQCIYCAFLRWYLNLRRPAMAIALPPFVSNADICGNWALEWGRGDLVAGHHVIQTNVDCWRIKDIKHLDVKSQVKCTWPSFVN